jgi:molybdate transport system substrate-binding protein
VKKILIFALALFISFAAFAEEKLTVFAAASLTNALSEVDAQFEKETGVKVVHSFAASSALAKQIESGAPADVFISADLKWMSYLQDKSLINKASKRNLLGNSLVLVTPKGKFFEVKFDKSFDLSKAFDGRLCTGDLESVPVGIYSKEALINLAWWKDIKSRIVGAQDVRAALMFVERGECAAGIIYATDAKVSNKVELLGIFPEASHSPVIYPVAATNHAQAKSMDYLAYLQSPQASAIFKRYGFIVNP